MLGLDRFCGVLALVTAAAAAVSCGGDEDAPANAQTSSTTASSSSSSSGTGGSGGTGGTGGDGGGGGAPTCPPTEGTTLALTKLYFGEGQSGEWKGVGLNIDGLVSDATSTDVCQPNSGGYPDTAYPDGDNGIDNSFGKNLLPTIIGLVPNWPAEVNTYLDIGYFNAMLKMYCLPPTGDAPQLTTKVFGGSFLGYAPKYDGTDMWPVAPEILADPQDPESSTLVFENSSVIGTTFDSGKGETFVLTIPMDYNGNHATIKLTLYAAQVIMTLSADRKSATGGVIGGVLNTEEFIDQVKKVGWMADFCGDPVFDGILTDVRRVSDIMTDGTQDPTKECDGISFGIQFEMKEVQLGDVGIPADVGMACP